jgi:translation elongation factor EF-G
MPFAVNDDGVPLDNVGEVKIRIIVPEEFVGASQQELTARQGLITGMEAQEHSVVIYASLPSEKYDGLVEAIVADTQGRGRVDLAEG